MGTKPMNKPGISVIGFCIAILLCSTACRKDGPAERAGERIDEVVDNVKDGENPLKKKGPAEKAGEAVDRAVDDSTK